MYKGSADLVEPELRAMASDAGYMAIVDRISAMEWSALDRREIVRVAKVYHYFSIQFRENLDIACRLYPDDADLGTLHVEECDTANLSPWEGVAQAGEKMDHDEFMARLLTLEANDGLDDLDAVGQAYLATTRAIDDLARAKSIASYEDSGLSRVFSAMLQAPVWEGSTLRAFEHFLRSHIEFDDDGDGGHGQLARRLVPDATIVPLWAAFEEMLHRAVPRIATAQS